jgi:hypothetical protein
MVVAMIITSPFASDLTVFPTLRDQLPSLAAMAEAQAYAAAECGRDMEADAMFLVQEHADGLFKALVMLGV